MSPVTPSLSLGRWASKSRRLRRQRAALGKTGGQEAGLELQSAPGEPPPGAVAAGCFSLSTRKPPPPVAFGNASGRQRLRHSFRARGGRDE